MSIVNNHDYETDDAGRSRRVEFFTPTCDICGETLADCDDREEAKTRMKEAGWQTKIYQGQHENYCPDCQ